MLQYTCCFWNLWIVFKHFTKNIQWNVNFQIELCSNIWWGMFRFWIWMTVLSWIFRMPPQSLTRLPKENQTQYDALLNLRRAFRPPRGKVESLTVFELKSVAIYDRNYGTVYGGNVTITSLKQYHHSYLYYVYSDYNINQDCGNCNIRPYEEYYC